MTEGETNEQVELKMLKMKLQLLEQGKNIPQRNNMDAQHIQMNNQEKPKRLNHFFWCLTTTFSGCICLPCWIGACLGVCPKCDFE